MLKIQIITGSTRPDRLNKQVADWVYEQTLDRKDFQVELVDIADYNLPLLDEPLPASSGKYTKEHTKKWSAKIAQADGFIFVTPEYNHSVSPALKNAVDFLFNEWNNKAIGFVGYGAVGGVRSVEHWRAIAGQMRLADVRAQLMVSLMDDFNDGRLAMRDFQAEALVTLLDELVSWSSAMKSIRS